MPGAISADSMKQHVARGRDFLQSVYPDSRDFRLEEIERDEWRGDEVLALTLSFVDPGLAPTGSLASLIGSRTMRRLVMQPTTGEILSMKLRRSLSD